MTEPALQQTIEALWEQRDTLSSATKGAARDAVEAALARWTTAACAWPNPRKAAGASISG